MLNIEDFCLYYEYTGVFDLEGMPHMESTYGKRSIPLKVGEILNLPIVEEIKSKIERIEEVDDKLVVTLNIPPKPLWENDGQFVVVTLGEVTKYYYGRTTINTQTDYYFKFEICKKELV